MSRYCVTTNSGSAEIYDMSDALARRRADAEAGLGDVGEQLAAAREAAGLTIDEAANKTHIQQRHLEAIETLEIESLPARPYAIGFVRTYAGFLGLDAAEIVERFKEGAGFGAAATTPDAIARFERADAAAQIENREMSFAAVIAIIAFFIWCAFQITLLDDSKREEGVNAPPAAPAVQSATARLPRPPAPARENIIEATILERVEPIYPRNCLENAQPFETVVIAFNITASGRVAGGRVAQSSNACLDAAALNAVRRWRFEPRKIDGAAQAVYDQRYSFTFARPR